MGIAQKKTVTGVLAEDCRTHTCIAIVIAKTDANHLEALIYRRDGLKPHRGLSDRSMLGDLNEAAGAAADG